MARKSRKHLIDAVTAPEVIPERVYYNAAAYVRLSSDDKKKRGDSLETQRNIIENFVATMADIRIVEVYTDNDSTGTNFNRPGFQKMLSDMEHGRINCIIVKDLSRFGRDAIDAGYYLEKHLPALGVRCIAVTDSYDSLDGDGGILLPLKNLINESYARDISRKCRAVQRQNIANGRFVGRLAPYGFKKSSDDCRKLIPDPETAPTVRQIFQWASGGANTYEIAHRLTDEGIPTPAHHNFAQGFHTSEKLRGTAYWKAQVVRKILFDRVYVGDMVQGKTRKVNRKQIQVDPSEWVCVPNTHEPIISPDIFDHVQALRQSVYSRAMEIKQTSTPYTTNVFTGKILCHRCGYPMHRKRQNSDGTYWFRCESQAKYGKKSCTLVSVKEVDLKIQIMTILHKQSEAIFGRYICLERSLPDNADAELHEINQELDKDGRMLRSLYENMVSNLITQAEFVQMKADYEAKIEALSKKADEIRNRRYEAKARVSEYRDVADAASAILSNDTLTAALMDRLIQEIRVYPNKSFDVLFRFCDELGEVTKVG